MPKTNVERHSIRNGIIASVVSGLLLAAIFSPTFRKWISLFITTTWKLITGTWDYLLASVAVPRCVLGLLILLSLVTLFRAVRPLFKSQAVAEPTWQSYTQDEFFGMVWRWDNYSRDPINSMRAFCPRCDTMLVYSEHVWSSDLASSTLFTCDTCGRQIAELEGSMSHVLGKIGRQIERKVRTGEWKRAIES